MVEVFFIPDNEQDVNYFKWTEDNTFREEFCIELMNSLVKKYGKKVIFDILENPEKNEGKVQDKVSGKFLYLVLNKS